MTASTRPFDCAGVKALAGLRPDDLPPAQHDAVAGHLQVCEACRREATAERELIDLLAGSPRLVSTLTAADVRALDAAATGRASDDDPVRRTPAALRGALPGGLVRPPSKSLRSSAPWRSHGAPASAIALAAAAVALVWLLPRGDVQGPAEVHGPPPVDLAAGPGPSRGPGAAETGTESPAPAPASPDGAIARPERPGYRWKGGNPGGTGRVDIVASVERRGSGGASLAGAPDGTRLAPADALAFRFAVDGSGWLLVVEVAPDGTLQPVYPEGGASAEVSTGSVALADRAGRPLVWRSEAGAGRYRYVALMGERAFAAPDLDPARIAASSAGGEVAPGVVAADVLEVDRQPQGAPGPTVGGE